MKAGGAQALLICANYPHKVADEVEKQSGLELLHIADFTAKEIVDSNKRKVGLLGTKMVMEEGYIKDRMKKKYGVDVLIPSSQSVRNELHEEFMNNLPSGKVSDRLREVLIRTTREMIDDGAEGLILGSTDLAFALEPEDVDVPLFDTNELHAKGVAEWLIEKGDVEQKTN